MKWINRIDLEPHSQDVIEHELEVLKKETLRVSHPDLIYAFGSVTRPGEFYPDSDIDLLIVFPDLTSLSKGQSRILRQGSSLTPRPVDRIFVDRETFERKKT